MSPTARPFPLATRVDLCQHRSHRHLLPARTPQVRLRESADNRLSVPRENRDSSRVKRYSRSSDIGFASTSAQHQPNTNPTSALIHRRPHESSQPADRQLCTAVDCGGPPRQHLQSPQQRFDSARRLLVFSHVRGAFRVDERTECQIRWRGNGAGYMSVLSLSWRGGRSTAVKLIRESSRVPRSVQMNLE